MNIKLVIEYDGEQFCGWQKQANLPTVQGEIEKALEHVVGHRVVVYGAGRTDSGVHARGQVANFHVETDNAPAQWQKILNALLPSTIRILKSSQVPDAFHACRSAVAKVYEYRILNRAYSSALDRRVYFYPHRVSWDKIRRALPVFIGEKDFCAFQSAGASVKTTTRRIYRFDLTEDDGNPGVFRFMIEGNGFLKQMVRALVGTLMEIGEGKREIESLPLVFESRKRSYAGRTLPAAGLCLLEVKYEDTYAD